MDENKQCWDCCDDEGICCTKSARCRYYCPLPPLLIDTVYHRFREPCLAIICMLLVLSFGSTSLYGLDSLTCDEMYIVDPICEPSAPTSIAGPGYWNFTIYNITQPILLAQNQVLYEFMFNDSIYIDNKYEIARFLDTASTFILLIGNSPYHSPFWLVIGFASSMYSTSVYTQSLEYCSGDYCKTKENDKFHIPEKCNDASIYYDDSYSLCVVGSDSYSLCTDCLCKVYAQRHCMGYRERDSFSINTRLYILMSYFWFCLIYLRQIVCFVVLMKLLYKALRRKMKQRQENPSLQLALFEKMDNNKQSNIVEEDGKKQESLTPNVDRGGLIEMETINDTEPETTINRSRNEQYRDSINNVFIFLSKWNRNVWYRKIYKIFTEPLSVRLTAASCICIIFLVVICQILYDSLHFIDEYIVMSHTPQDTFSFIPLIFYKHEGINAFIMSLLWVDGLICMVIYLRCIWIIHHQFRSDIIAVCSHYNDVEYDDMEKQNENIGNDTLRKLKKLFRRIFPSHVPCRKNIVEHVKKCKVMNAYLYIFMYPVSLMTGCILLFIGMALFVLLLAAFIWFALNSSFDVVLLLIWDWIKWVFKRIWPLLFIIIFDRCILQGTNTILTQRKIHCLWYVTLFDIISTMTSALFLTLLNIFGIRLVFLMGVFCYGLIHPYKSVFPSPFEMYDKVYHSYCSNVALTSLSLLKSNQNMKISPFSEKQNITD